MSERKWLTEPDEYVCTLSAETQQIAKDELREDNFTRNQALEAMRTWIVNNPRISNCRLGDINIKITYFNTLNFFFKFRCQFFVAVFT